MYLSHFATQTKHNWYIFMRSTHSANILLLWISNTVISSAWTTLEVCFSCSIYMTLWSNYWPLMVTFDSTKTPNRYALGCNRMCTARVLTMIPGWQYPWGRGEVCLDADPTEGRLSWPVMHAGKRQNPSEQTDVCKNITFSPQSVKTEYFLRSCSVTKWGWLICCWY